MAKRRVIDWTKLSLNLSGLSDIELQLQRQREAKERQDAIIAQAAPRSTTERILRTAQATPYALIGGALNAPGEIYSGLERARSPEGISRDEAIDLSHQIAGAQFGGAAPPGALASGRSRMPKRARGLIDEAPARSNVGVDASVGFKENPPVFFRGKEPNEFTPEDWHAFGQEHGTGRPLGPESEAAWRAGMTSHTLPSGKTFQVPGGTDPFTYYDTLFMKSQGVPTKELASADPALRQAIHDRMAAATTPFEAPGQMAPHSLFNKLVMGMESPNNPLTPNQLAFARTMAKGPQDLERWSQLVPWRYGAEGVTPEMRLQVSNEIANAMGINAAEHGGLGARGTTDYTRVAELAQMVRDKPEFFAFRGEKEGGANPSEQWANFVQRVTSQVPGLSAKTGSFGVVWQDPTKAATSAIDRHMVRKADKEGALFANEDARIEAERLAVNRHFVKTGKTVDSFEALPKKEKDEAYFGYLNAHPTMNVRTAKGALNPKLPEGVLGADWVREPKQVQTISEPYKNVQEVNRQAAEKLGQGLFSHQWHVWDELRNRLEPHENLNPALEQLPRMSQEQVIRAREAHARAGYLGAPGKPVGTVENPSSLAFFTRPGVAAAPVAMGSVPVNPAPEDPLKLQNLPAALSEVPDGFLDPELLRRRQQMGMF